MAQFEITPDMQAPKSLRFAHLIIDYLASMAFVFVLLFILVFIATIFGDTSLLAWTSSESISVNIVCILLVLLYYFGFEAITSRTLGKFITGCIVVTEDGEKPTTSDILSRTFCRIIPFEIFSFLGEVGWHDSISRTRVVKKHIYVSRKTQVVELDEIGKDSELL